MNALFLATAMAVTPAPAAPTHDVLAGESLSQISLCELGDAGRWVELVELNGELITDPNIIEPGWTLALPDGASGDCPTEPTVEVASAAPSPAAPSAPAPSEAAPAPEEAAPAQQAQPSETSSGEGLADIRACESGGDYGAVSSSGKYRGAYQFDQQTWESVGGSGDPADASPAEQDQRAAALQQQRGSSPWPRCG